MYNCVTVSTRIKTLAKSKKIPLKAMLSELGLGVNLISQVANGQNITSANLTSIADYLDCSVDYLLGRIDNPEHVNISQGNYVNNSSVNTIAQNYGQGTQTVKEAASSSPSDECTELLRIYTALPFRQRVELLNVALRLEGEASAG